MSGDDGGQFSEAIAQFAGRVQQLVEAAVPAASRLAALIRVGALAGLVGGVAGAVGLAMPGVGLVRNGPLCAVLLLVAVAAAITVLRWGRLLATWSGDVGEAVQRLRDIPSPADLAGRIRAMAGEIQPTPQKEGARHAVFALLGAAAQIRTRWRDVPHLADRAKDISVRLTGPFRPPMLAVRLALLAGGLCMAVIGPVLLVLAVAF